ERDLAVLKATHVKNAPRPIDLSSVAAPRETMALWVLGFPFGEALSTNESSPAVTIGRGMAASLRRDKRGKLAAVQFDGAINPGNSGGPIVDTEGHLVGVATLTIRGAGLGFAIPAEQVKELLEGSVRGERFTPLKVSNGRAEIAVALDVFDPLQRLKKIRL